MAFKQNNRDLQAQEAQFMEMFFNLSMGQEELKALFNRNLTKKHPDNNKDDQLEQLQSLKIPSLSVEVAIVKDSFIIHWGNNL